MAERSRMHRAPEWEWAALGDSYSGPFRLVADDLDDAAAEVRGMSGADEFKPYERAWRRYLHQIDSAWEKLMAAAKHGAGRKWAESARAQRDADQVLTYLKAARNAAHHSVDEVVIPTESTASFGALPGHGGMMPTLVINGDHIHVSGNRASIPLVIATHRWRGRALPIQDSRGGVAAQLPRMHRGVPIDGSDPLRLARAGLLSARVFLEEGARPQEEPT